MAINVTLGEVKTQDEKLFPKLMISGSGAIWLMTNPFNGIFITGNTQLQVGHICEDFGPHMADYNEPITLQNA